MPSSSPSWRPRSRSSRCAATASMPRCSTATSSCLPMPSGSAIDVAPGTGPVAERPLRSAADLDAACGRSSRTDISYVADTVELRRRRAARRRAAAGVRRRPVHGRQLSDRRPPQPRLPPHQGDDAHRRAAAGTAVMERLADSAITFIDVQLEPRCGRLPVVRLVGGHASRRRLRAVRAAPLTAGVRRARRPSSRCAVASTSGSGATTCSRRCTPPDQRDRARLANADQRRPRAASVPTWWCRATSIRRSCSPAPHAGPGRHRRGARRQRRPPRSHLQPRSRRASRHRPRSAGRDRRPRARRATAPES